MAGKKGRTGTGGRKVKEIKLLQGTFRPDREPANVPDPIYSTPEQPDKLTERAAELWQEFVVILGAGGRNVLTAADGRVLGVFCECLAAFEDKPSASMANQVRQFAGLFGLTPADRQRIPAIAPPKSGRKVLKPRSAK